MLQDWSRVSDDQLLLGAKGYIGSKSNRLAFILPDTLHMDVIPNLYRPTNNFVCPDVL